jgi:hypothetical protein
LPQTTWSKVQRVTGSAIGRALARAYVEYERRHESEPDFLPLYAPEIWRSYALEKLQGARPRLPWLSVLLRAYSNATRRQGPDRVRPAWLNTTASGVAHGRRHAKAGSFRSVMNSLENAVDFAICA